MRIGVGILHIPTIEEGLSAKCNACLNITLPTELVIVLVLNKTHYNIYL